MNTTMHRGWGVSAAALLALCGAARANAETGAYLGVVTHAMDPAMAPHVGLQPGFGLVVDDVDRAGAAAGRLHKNDILYQLDDQRLVSPRHLAVLVRSHQPGDVVTLGLIRMGQAMESEAILTEHVLDPLPGEGGLPPAVNPPPPVLHALGPTGQPPVRLPDDVQRSITREMDKVRYQQEQVRQVQEATRRAIEEARQSMRGIAPPFHPRTTGRTFNSTRVQVLSRDGLSLTLTATDGDARLRAVGEDGDVLFEGPVNTDEDRAALPPAVAELYQSMEPSSDPLPLDPPAPPADPFLPPVPGAPRV